MAAAQQTIRIDSGNDLRDYFEALFGHVPNDIHEAPGLLADWIDTPLGGMIVIADNSALHLLEFTERKALPQGLRRLSQLVGGRIDLGRTPITDQTEAALKAYFTGDDLRLNVPIKLHGTAFQQQVWQQLQEIAPGTTHSYAQVAALIGRPTATRAVAAANAANRLALVVPCHRVIGANGALTGYAGGMDRKQRLIALEGAYSANKA